MLFGSRFPSETIFIANFAGVFASFAVKSSYHKVREDHARFATTIIPSTACILSPETLSSLSATAPPLS